MTTRLSSLLVQDGVVSVKRMEEAFQRQVIYGGALDTILLEMRVIDEPRLTRYLEQASGLAAAEPTEIFAVDETAVRLCPRAEAEAAGVAPLGLADGLLRVLVTDPPDRARLDTLGFHLGVTVEPRIAPECRLYQAWNLRYGQPLPARYATLVARLAAPEVGAATARPPMSEPARPTSPESPAPAEPAPAEDARHAALSPLPIDAATELVAQAQNRDEILDAFVRAARGRLEYVALFTVQGVNALGRVALSKTGSQDLSQVSVRLEGESAMAAASRSAAPYLGPPGADLANDACFAALGRPRPATIVIVPVVIRGRCVALLYGDRGHRAIPAAQVVDLFTLGHEVGRAFSRLIMRAKGTAYSAAAAGAEGQLPPAAAAPTRAERSAAGAWGAADDAAAARMGAPDAPAPDGGAAAERTSPDVVAAAAAPAPGSLDAPAAAAAVPVGPFDVGASGPTEAPGAARAGGGSPPEGAADAVPDEVPARAELGDGDDEDATAGVVPSRPLEEADTDRHRTVDPWSQPEPVLELDAEPPPDGARDGDDGGGLEVIADLPSGPMPLAPNAILDIAAAAVAAPARPRRGPVPVGSGVTVVSTREIDALLDEIERAPQSAEAHLAAAAIERMGEPAIEVLVRRFPGRLRCDRFAQHGKLPPVGEHSELLRILIDFGRPAVRHVLPLLGSPDLDVRFYATYLFSELVFSEVVPAVATRVYDPDYSIRSIAVEVLRRYTATPEMKEILERARGELPGPDGQRQRYAAEALGELRDVASVARLIQLVKHRDEAIAEAARRALTTITKQDFGASARHWRGWWEKNRARNRIEWLIDGLAHGTSEIRLAAAEELRRLTHQHFGYHFDLPKREREEARQRWVTWWEQYGRRSVGG